MDYLDYINHVADYLDNEKFEEISGVLGARFCHNTRFLLSCNTIEAAYQLIDKALSSDINKNIDL